MGRNGISNELSDHNLMLLFAKHKGVLTIKRIRETFGPNMSAINNSLRRLGATRLKRGVYQFGLEELEALHGKWVQDFNRMAKK